MEDPTQKEKDLDRDVTNSLGETTTNVITFSRPEIDDRLVSRLENVEKMQENKSFSDQDSMNSNLMKLDDNNDTQIIPEKQDKKNSFGTESNLKENVLETNQSLNQTNISDCLISNNSTVLVNVVSESNISMPSSEIDNHDQSTANLKNVSNITENIENKYEYNFNRDEQTTQSISEIPSVSSIVQPPTSEECSQGIDQDLSIEEKSDQIETIGVKRGIEADYSTTDNIRKKLKTEGDDIERTDIERTDIEIHDRIAESEIDRSQNLYDEEISMSEACRYKLSSTNVPKLVNTASLEFSLRSENFLRGCKCSPDGKKILTNSNDNCLRVFNTSRQSELDWRSESRIQEKSLVYDFCWFPGVDGQWTNSSRVVSTCSGIPIHVWDSQSSEVITSYKAFDQYDEVTAAYSLAVSEDRLKLFAGYKKTIRIFDVATPNLKPVKIETFNTKHKDGQTGIISCFSVNQSQNILVAGSYSRHVGIYDLRSNKLVCLLQGQQGGITHTILSPDGSRLYCGGRKDPEIMCWDMRATGKVICSYLRDVQTNQRMYFDLSGCGSLLVTGNHDGTVNFWNTRDPGEKVDDACLVRPSCVFTAHRDCVNGVSLNMDGSTLVTSSGQRHFSDLSDGDSGSDSAVEMEPKDFSLRLWRIPL